jgi:four helix bundle protein
MRVKISRKEVKESVYWIRLIYESNNLSNTDEAKSLLQEADQ